MISFVIRDGIGIETFPIVVLEMCWWVEKQRWEEVTWMCAQDGQFITKFNLAERLEEEVVDICLFFKRTPTVNLFILSSAVFYLFFSISFCLLSSQPLKLSNSNIMIRTCLLEERIICANICMFSSRYFSGKTDNKINSSYHLTLILITSN